jgi:hypothetical protein
MAGRQIDELTKFYGAIVGGSFRNQQQKALEENYFSNFIQNLKDEMSTL